MLCLTPKRRLIDEANLSEIFTFTRYGHYASEVVKIIETT